MNPYIYIYIYIVCVCVARPGAHYFVNFQLFNFLYHNQLCF